jgi:hypothetical protein
MGTGPVSSGNVFHLNVPKQMFSLFHLGRINHSEDIQRCLKYNIFVSSFR